MPCISALSASALVKQASATSLMKSSRITVQVRKEIESLSKIQAQLKRKRQSPYQAALAFQGMTDKKKL